MKKRLDVDGFNPLAINDYYRLDPDTIDLYIT